VDVEDIRALTGFIAVEIWWLPTYPFEFGAVSGVRWCSTEIIPVTTSVTGSSNTALRGSSVTVHDVYRSYVIGMEAVGSVGLGNMHATTSYEMYDPKKPPVKPLPEKRPPMREPPKKKSPIGDPPPKKKIRAKAV
jgi:hypothetical protein